MNKDIFGIHHVTAITSDPQRNNDFYTGILGLRFVKLTVNQDDPTSYRLYFGDELGWPGAILTLFHWPDIPRGHRGTGQARVNETRDLWVGFNKFIVYTLRINIIANPILAF